MWKDKSIFNGLFQWLKIFIILCEKSEEFILIKSVMLFWLLKR